MTNEHAGLTSH